MFQKHSNDIIRDNYSKIFSREMGFIVGNAMGVPTEFESRENLFKHLVTTMIGYGSHPVLAGSWSDDTSMTLAFIDSINQTKKIDYDAIMKNFVDWIDDGKYTPQVKVFDISEIKSSGYVVDTLEATLWMLFNTKSYKEAIIGCINLGQDTDTIAAICGSMAGLIYGFDAIPEKWLNTLIRKEYIYQMLEDFEKVLLNNH